MLVLVPPTEIWKILDKALKSRRGCFCSSVALRGFACNLIDQALEPDVGNHALDIAICNAKIAIERVLTTQASENSTYNTIMRSALKSRILQFALHHNDMDLFHKACNPPLEPTKGSHDTPPLPSFFAWLRSYFMKKTSVSFTSIEDE